MRYQYQITIFVVVVVVVCLKENFVFLTTIRRSTRKTTDVTKERIPTAMRYPESRVHPQQYNQLII